MDNQISHQLKPGGGCTMKPLIKWLILLLGMTMLLGMGCGSSNRLMEYDFREHTAAGMMAVPPPPEIFTDSFFMVDEGDLLATAIRIGTTIAKEVEIAETQQKLDQAMEEVDVPEIIRMEALHQCAKTLRAEPVDDENNSDFLFDFQIQNYGIDAKSWSASVHFKIDVKVFLIDNEDNTEIWRKRVRERMPISREVFGLPDAAGDIITAVALSNLTVEQMADGFEHLALYTADRVARRLQHDLAKARSKKK